MSDLSKTVAIELKSYPTSKDLLGAEAGKMFLALKDKSLIEVGYLFGLDRWYKNEASMKSAVMRAYSTVLENPKQWDIEEKEAGLIQGIVQSRNVNKKEPETLRETQKGDILSEVLQARDISVRLMKKSLEYLEKHPKALKTQNIVSLAKVMGILFDKGQIVSGQATENIAVMSNLPDKIDPIEAMKAIMSMRESTLAEKQ